MSKCPFNKSVGVGCPFYRVKDKGDYCACLQGDCPVESPVEEVTILDTTNVKPVVVQETHPIPSICYSADDFFDLSEQDNITLEEALINRIWMLWEELDARSKNQKNRNCLHNVPWEALCDAGIEIFRYLKSEASYYDRD